MNGILKASYVKGASSFGDCIQTDLPQIAVCGKSNVGKSSFINTLCGDAKMARVSKSPGRTALVNYFLADGLSRQFMLVDLPGYGYAEVSKSEKDRWASLLENYFSSKMAKHVLFLVDIRHTPTQDDSQMFKYLFVNGCQFTLIATKADKIAKSKVSARLAEIAEFFRLGRNDVIAFSSETKIGLQQVATRLNMVLEN